MGAIDNNSPKGLCFTFIHDQVCSFADSSSTTQIDRVGDYEGSCKSPGVACTTGGSAVFRTTGNYPTETKLTDKDSHGNVPKSIEYYEKELNIAKEAGDRAAEAEAYWHLGSAYESQGNFPKAITYYEKRVNVAGEAGDWAAEGKALLDLGTVYSIVGCFLKASKCFEKNLELARKAGDRVAESDALIGLGAFYLSGGDFEKAIKHFEESSNIAREAGYQAGETLALESLGRCYVTRGKFEKGTECREEYLKIFREWVLVLGRQQRDQATISRVIFTALFVNSESNEFTCYYII